MRGMHVCHAPSRVTLRCFRSCGGMLPSHNAAPIKTRKRKARRPFEGPRRARQIIPEDELLSQQIISGLATGSLYALTAIAVVVVFRNTRTINVAQGDFSMMAAFFAVTFLKSGLNYYATIAMTVAATILLGILVERLVMRPIADSNWLTLFTATLGVYYITHG